MSFARRISVYAKLTRPAVIQRVKSASVTVDGQLISTISKGLLIFAAIGKDDTPKEVESMASKILKVKLWNDDQGGKWKKNVQEIDGDVLCGTSRGSFSRESRCHGANLLIVAVSQFTLLASTKKGNKPDFHKAAPPAKGKDLYDAFLKQVRSLYREDRVKDGVFQAMMDVGIVNDGPVGIDYSCVDEAVHWHLSEPPLAPHTSNADYARLRSKSIPIRRK